MVDAAKFLWRRIILTRRIYIFTTLNLEVQLLKWPQLHQFVEFHSATFLWSQLLLLLLYYYELNGHLAHHRDIGPYYYSITVVITIKF